MDLVKVTYNLNTATLMQLMTYLRDRRPLESFSGAGIEMPCFTVDLAYIDFGDGRPAIVDRMKIATQLVLDDCPFTGIKIGILDISDTTIVPTSRFAHLNISEAILLKGCVLEKDGRDVKRDCYDSLIRKNVSIVPCAMSDLDQYSPMHQVHYKDLPDIFHETIRCDRHVKPHYIDNANKVKDGSYIVKDVDHLSLVKLMNEEHIQSLTIKNCSLYKRKELLALELITIGELHLIDLKTTLDLSLLEGFSIQRLHVYGGYVVGFPDIGKIHNLTELVVKDQKLLRA